MIKVVRKEYDTYAQEKAKVEKESKLKAEREEQRRKEAEAKKAASQPQEPAKAPEPPKAPVETTITEEKPAEEAKEESGDGKTIVRDEKKAPPGNGGSTDKYVWTQTLDEVNTTYSLLFIELSL